MVALYRKSDAILDLIEVDLRVIVEDVLVENLADGRIVAIKELDHFDGGVDEDYD